MKATWPPLRYNPPAEASLILLRKDLSLPSAQLGALLQGIAPGRLQGVESGPGSIRNPTKARGHLTVIDGEGFTPIPEI